MQASPPITAADGFRATACLLASVVAGCLAFASLPHAAAETAPRNKPPAEDAETPALRKKQHPKSTSKTEPDPKAAAANASGTKSKTKTINAAVPAKAKKSDAEPQASPVSASATAPNVSIATDDLVEFHAQPAGVKKLIESCLALARQNLTYTFGSCDPAVGGLDCSGFIYFVLRQHGFAQVPRDSSEQYTWVRRARGFRAVISRKADSFEMDELLPGDLLFWTGTYATAHDPPISHVMLYLGTEKSTGAKVMVGSSDGRAYHGLKRNGVSVFDFAMPRTPVAGEPRSTFVGYARIPGLRE